MEFYHCINSLWHKLAIFSLVLSFEEIGGDPEHLITTARAIASTQMGRTFTRNTANTKQNDIVTPVGTLFREVFSQIGYGRKRPKEIAKKKKKRRTSRNLREV